MSGVGNWSGNVWDVSSGEAAGYKGGSQENVLICLALPASTSPVHYHFRDRPHAVFNAQDENRLPQVEAPETAQSPDLPPPAASILPIPQLCTSPPRTNGTKMKRTSRSIGRRKQGERLC